MTKSILEELDQLNREELLEKWKELFNTDPPLKVRREFLVKHIVWELQAKKYGGLSFQSKKKLEKLKNELAKENQISQNSIETLKNKTTLDIKAGTKLIREYQGKKHEVIALEKGFEYKNKFYKSLSAIANEITGSRWNGKVFFGLK